MGMGLVSEAAAVELGIQTREDGEARVRVSRSSGNIFLAGSTISGNRPLLMAERDNPWLPSALHHQVLFHLL